MSINKVTLKGRLGKEPELNNNVVKFSIATDDGYKKSTGEKVENTNWHNITAFGKLGEILHKYLKKGDEVVVMGRLEYNQHNEKWYTSIIANDFDFCGSSKTQSNNQQNQNNDFDAPASFYQDQNEPPF